MKMSSGDMYVLWHRRDRAFDAEHELGLPRGQVRCEQCKRGYALSEKHDCKVPVKERHAGGVREKERS